MPPQSPNPAPPNPLLALLDTPAPPHLDRSPRTSTLPLTTLQASFNSFRSSSPLQIACTQEAWCVLLIWHDHWDPAHQIAQDLHTASGSLLHAILHRREPDFWNSKYWLRSAGAHPALSLIAQALTQSTQFQNQPWLQSQRLNATTFVDACEQVAHLRPDHPSKALLEAAQAIELRTLLNFFSQPS